MKASLRLLASTAFAAAITLPALGFAAEVGNNNGNNPVGNMPSQRYSVNNAGNAQGAALVVDPSGVRQVQQALNRLGYSAGPITGNWDQGTQRAMRQFQEAHGLVPDGDLTLSAIAALGLWENIIGNPNGNGNRPLAANAASGAPRPRGEGGGGVTTANGNGGNAGGGGGGAALSAGGGNGGGNVGAGGGEPTTTGGGSAGGSTGGSTNR